MTSLRNLLLVCILLGILLSSCYVYAEKRWDECSWCKGKGVLECLSCDGTGIKDCNRCFGDGICPYDPGGICSKCKGRGWVFCDRCDGKGWEECRYCDGKGGRWVEVTQEIEETKETTKPIEPAQETPLGNFVLVFLFGMIMAVIAFAIGRASKK